jgi:ABC-2 type transport system permease protein
MKVKWELTIASLKMFYRQREAIIWTILFPLFIIILFGFVRFSGLGKVQLSVVNEAGPAGEAFIKRLKSVQTLDVVEGSRESEFKELSKGERDLVLILPQGFDTAAGGTLTVYGDVEAKPQQAQLGALVLQRVLDETVFTAHPQASRKVVKTETVKTRNLTYLDFLLPGVLAMSIMQAGIFGVAFSFVSLKKRGILRRLWVTPINPNDFIIAQMTMRLSVVLLQITIMITVGLLLLNFHFIGNLAIVYLLGVGGAVVFLGFGLALAGFSKSEDQVAPLANVISLPMLALSGVFFSRSDLPGFLRTITDVFPLTYLADGIRSVAIDGATLVQVVPQIIGLGVWSIVAIFIAVKLFHWE